MVNYGLLLFAILTLPLMVSADSIRYQTYSAKDKKYIEIETIEHGDVQISKSCLPTGKKNCMAWKAVENKKPKSGSVTGLAGNPAGRYCFDQGGFNRIFFANSKKQEFDFCVFKDGSAVDAWTLFNKHHKAKL